MSVGRRFALPAAVIVAAASAARAEEPGASTRASGSAVAAFPDVQPSTVSFPATASPKARSDTALPLLDTNPYEAQLTRYKIARNLYGDGPDLESDPYIDQLRLANPYVEQAALAADPYADYIPPPAAFTRKEPSWRATPRRPSRY